MSASTPPVLDADLTAGLRRLKLAAMRQLAPELLVTANVKLMPEGSQHLRRVTQSDREDQKRHQD